MWRLSVKSERWWERWAGRSYPRLYLSLVSTRLREVLVNNSPRRYLAGFYPTDRDIWTDCGGGGLIYFCIKKRNTSRSWDYERWHVSERRKCQQRRDIESCEMREREGSVQWRAGSDTSVCLYLISPPPPHQPGERRDREDRWGVFTLAERLSWYCRASQTALLWSARYQPNNGRFHPEYNCSLGRAG